MPRPHTEFLDTPALPWAAWSRAGLDQPLEAKILSEDPESGACSLLLRYPAGYISPDTAMSAAEEIFVIDGSLDLAGHRFNEHDYGFVPTRAQRNRVSSATGATVLTFYDANPNDTAVATNAAVLQIATAEQPWTPGNPDPNLKFMGLGRKVLRDDPERQERTLLLSMAPQAYPNPAGAPQIAHPCVEEMFLFSGDVISEYGLMESGAYFWRPAMILHGPHGCRNGAFMLIRFVEGRHENIWGDEIKQFNHHPPYRPVLPDHHRGSAV